MIRKNENLKNSKKVKNFAELTFAEIAKKRENAKPRKFLTLKY